VSRATDFPRVAKRFTKKWRSALCCLCFPGTDGQDQITPWINFAKIARKKSTSGRIYTRSDLQLVRSTVRGRHPGCIQCSHCEQARFRCWHICLLSLLFVWKTTACNAT